MKRLFVIVLLLCSISVSAQLEPIKNEANKWGYKDKKTGKIIPFLYDYATDFENGKALVEKGGTHFVIDEEGKELVELPYPNLNRSFEAGTYMFSNDTLEGMVNSSGEIIYKVNFKRSYKTQGIGLRVMRDGNKVGFYSIYKGVLLPLEYECRKFEWLFMNVTGEQNKVYLEDNDALALKHKDKWGVVTPHGNILVPFTYDYLDPVEHSLKFNSRLGACKNGKCGIIDTYSNVIIPFENDAYLGYFLKTDSGSYIGSFAYVFMRNNKVIFYDDYTKKVIPRINPAKDGKWVMWYLEVFDGKKAGAIDNEGNILIPLEYDGVYCMEGTSEFHANPKFLVTKEGKRAIFRVGQGLITPMLDCDIIYQYVYKDKPLNVLVKKGFSALFDDKFKQITNFEYDELYAHENAIHVKKGNKEGKMNLTGEVIWDNAK